MSLMDLPKDKKQGRRKTHNYKFGSNSGYANAWDAFMKRRNKKLKKEKKDGVLTK